MSSAERGDTEDRGGKKVIMRNFRIIGLIIGILFSLQCSSKTVERVVSLAQSLTKDIYFLDAQDLLIGCTSYCTEAIADNKEVIGSAVKINIEKVISLKPDLVLTTPLTDSETIDMLRKFGIQVEVFASAKSFDEICNQFIEIGKLLNREEKAFEVVNQSKNKKQNNET